VTHACRHARERAIATFRVINPAVIDQFLLYLREIKQSRKLKYNFRDAFRYQALVLDAILSRKGRSGTTWPKVTRYCYLLIPLFADVFNYLFLRVVLFPALFLRCTWNTYKEPEACAWHVIYITHSKSKYRVEDWDLWYYAPTKSQRKSRTRESPRALARARGWEIIFFLGRYVSVNTFPLRLSSRANIRS